MLAIDEFIAIIGGLDADNALTSSFLLYDPLVDLYFEGPPLPTPLYRFGMAGLPGPEGMSDGKIYVVGGLESTADDAPPSDRVFVFNLQTARWSEGPNLTTARSDLCAYGVNGKVYAAGGWNEGFSETLASVEVLDPEGEGWELVEDMPTPRGDCQCGVIGNSLVVAGGFYDPTGDFRADQFRTEVEAYDTVSAVWLLL